MGVGSNPTSDTNHFCSFLKTPIILLQVYSSSFNSSRQSINAHLCTPTVLVFHKRERQLLSKLTSKETRTPFPVPTTVTIQSARDLLNLFGMHGELQFEALQVGDLMIRKLSLFPSEEQGFHTDQMSKYTELNYLH